MHRIDLFGNPNYWSPIFHCSIPSADYSAYIDDIRQKSWKQDFRLPYSRFWDRENTFRWKHHKMRHNVKDWAGKNLAEP